MITILLEDKRFSKHKGLRAQIKLALTTTLDHLAFDEKVTVAFLLTHKDHIQKLNAAFRGKEKPTNVLSFPAEENPFIKASRRHLGDIALCYDVIEDEARSQNKSFKDHFTHLVIHGILHLMGYDHEKDDEAEEMESLEICILEKLAIANPYKDFLEPL